MFDFHFEFVVDYIGRCFTKFYFSIIVFPRSELYLQVDFCGCQNNDLDYSKYELPTLMDFHLPIRLILNACYRQCCGNAANNYGVVLFELVCYGFCCVFAASPSF